jgi:hypothetical protein
MRDSRGAYRVLVGKPKGKKKTKAEWAGKYKLHLQERVRSRGLE